MEVEIQKLTGNSILVNTEVVITFEVVQVIDHNVFVCISCLFLLKLLCCGSNESKEVYLIQNSYCSQLYEFLFWGDC